MTTTFSFCVLIVYCLAFQNVLHPWLSSCRGDQNDDVEVVEIMFNVQQVEVWKWILELF